MTLQERLRALTEPCREADAEIAEAITGMACIWSRPICGYRFADGGAEVPHYTDSLDATVDLIEREMPEAEVCLNIYGMAFAMVYNGGGPSKEVEHHHTIPAVALLLALLEAKGIE
jgi:hypothetical protein